MLVSSVLQCKRMEWTLECSYICFEFVVDGDKLGTKLCQGSTSILDAFPEQLGGSIRSC